jgi:hypothetical protein
MGFLLHKSIYVGLERLDALGADILTVESNDILGAVTEDTSGLIFFHHNAGAVDIDLETVALCDVKRTTKLDGEDNAAQLVDFTYDTGRFHKFHPFPADQVFLQRAKSADYCNKLILLQRQNLSICKYSLFVVFFVVKRGVCYKKHHKTSKIYIFLQLQNGLKTELKGV